MAFVELPAAAIDAATEAGVLFYRMGETEIRLVTSWQTTPEDVAGAAAAFRAAMSAGPEPAAARGPARPTASRSRPDVSSASSPGRHGAPG